MSLMSGAAPYNIFHIVFGTIGLALALSKNERLIIGFNYGFGAIDLFQVLAHSFHLFPESYFRWTQIDDLVHVAIGSTLVTIALSGYKHLKSPA